VVSYLTGASVWGMLPSREMWWATRGRAGTRLRLMNSARRSQGVSRDDVSARVLLYSNVGAQDD
jgi:hypothetical protein